MDDIFRKIEEAKHSKTTLESQWEVCLRFLDGRQHENYTPLRPGVATTSSAPRRVVINLISPIYKNILSRLATNYPGVAVMPSSPDPQHVSQAQASEVYLRYVWHQAKLDTVFRRATEYLLSLGTTALQICWDQSKAIPSVKAVSPYDLFWEAGVLNWQDSSWLAVRKWASRKDVARQFPELADTLAETTSPAGSSASYPSSKLYYGQGNPQPESVEVFDYYCDGTHSIVIPSLQAVAWEDATPNGITPVHPIVFTEVPNIAWGKGIVEPLVDLQRIYNAGREMVMLNAATMAQPKWLVPKEAGVADDALTTRPGERVYYNAGFAPQQQAGAPLPAYVIDSIRQTAAEMQDVSGIHSATLGRQPKGGLSGVALQTLTENDLSSIQVSMDAMEDAARSAAESLLCYAKAFMPERVMVRQFGNLGHAVFRQIERADIVEHPTLFVEAGSLFRDKIQDREARVLAQYQAGLLDKDQAIKEVSQRTGAAYIQQRMAEASHATELLDTVRKGAVIELLPTDDPQVFTEVFSEFVRSPDYYMLPPERQGYIVDLLRQWNPALQAPGIPADPAGQLGLAESPTGKAQALAGVLRGVQAQQEGDAVEAAVTNDVPRADGAVPMEA